MRIEDAQINQVIESSKQSMQTTEKETQEDDMIQIDDFTKIDLRIAKIVKAQAVTIPCEMPNFIFLGAKLATITVSRPSKSSGL
jgi:hypothetical protein